MQNFLPWIVMCLLVGCSSSSSNSSSSSSSSSGFSSCANKSSSALIVSPILITSAPPHTLTNECVLQPKKTVDAQAPVLTLRGARVVTVPRDSVYVDAGATANDPQECDLSSAIKVTGLDKINTSEVADYLIRYDVMDADQHAAQSRTRIVRVTDGTRPKYSLREFGLADSPLGFLEHLPTFMGDDPRALYPLLIYAHGWGHYVQQAPSYDPLSALLEGANIYRVFDEKLWPDSRPFIVLEPQRCDGESVGDVEWQQVDQFIEWALATYPIDPERVYMMGLSDGAHFTYRYPVLFPNRLAAIAPMSGGGPVGSSALIPAFCAAMEHMPIWAFHGDADPTAPISHTFYTFDVLNRRCPLPPTPTPLLTVVTAGDHVIINRIADDSYIGQGDPQYTIQRESLYDWFLQYSRFKN